MTTEMVGEAYRDFVFLELATHQKGNREMQARCRRIRFVLSWAMAAHEVISRVSTDAKPGEPISDELVAYVSKLLAE